MKIKLPEIINISIYDSNIAIKNKIVTEKRRTSMFEIEIPIEKGGISYMDSEKFNLTPDMIICAKPGQLRHTRLPFKCYYIHFNLTDCDLYTKLIELPAFLKTDKYQKYYEMFQKLYKFYNTSIDTDEIIVQSLVLELLYNLISDSKKQKLKQQLKAGNYEAINKSIEFMKGHLTDDLSLTNLSAIAGFSPAYFHKLFKVSTGKTVREYVEYLRIKKAANLIIETNLTITEIAYECGFSSQSYFNYVFKRTMNMTPRQYANAFYEQYTKSF